MIGPLFLDHAMNWLVLLSIAVALPFAARAGDAPGRRMSMAGILTLSAGDNGKAPLPQLGVTMPVEELGESLEVQKRLQSLDAALAENAQHYKSLVKENVQLNSIMFKRQREVFNKDKYKDKPVHAVHTKKEKNASKPGAPVKELGESLEVQKRLPSLDAALAENAQHYKSLVKENTQLNSIMFKRQREVFNKDKYKDKNHPVHAVHTKKKKKVSKLDAAPEHSASLDATALSDQSEALLDVGLYSDTTPTSKTVALPGYKVTKEGKFDRNSRYGCNIAARYAIFSCASPDAMGKNCGCQGLVQVMHDMRVDILPTVAAPQQALCHSEFVAQARLAVKDSMKVYGETVDKKLTQHKCGIVPPSLQNAKNNPEVKAYAAAVETGETTFKVQGLDEERSELGESAGVSEDEEMLGYKLFKNGSLADGDKSGGSTGVCKLGGKYSIFVCQKCACRGGLVKQNFETTMNNGLTPDVKKQAACFKAYAKEHKDLAERSLNTYLDATEVKFKEGCGTFVRHNNATKATSNSSMLGAGTPAAADAAKQKAAQDKAVTEAQAQEPWL